MQIFKAMDDFHNAVVDKNFCIGQELVNQRDEFDALANLRDLAVNRFAAPQCVTDFVQNSFQNRIAVAETSIIGMPRVQSAQNQNINLNVGKERRADKLRREG